MIALVGYTGFVGSNIYASAKEQIDAVYNSKNIKEAYGTKPDLLIYSGVRAEKYLANQNPEKDMEKILEAQHNIEQIQPKRVVLISTVDVFQHPIGVDETSEIDTNQLHAYGYNRYQLERWVRAYDPEALIIRLPGLYGKNLKKNFIYDFIHRVPFMLKEEKFQELAQKNENLRSYYEKQENGFYRRIDSGEAEDILKEMFQELGFSALNFTDSRNVYQFYSLENLWADIQKALESGIRLWHPATEPVSAGELYEYLTGEQFVNELGGEPVRYDYRTMYEWNPGDTSGYVQRKADVMKAIGEFVSGACSS
jgi:nucleoside-diphosphate-sugar epimerase